MERSFYLDLAHRGLCMPIGADLLLHECETPGNVELDGRALGKVLLRTAMRYGKPLAFPLMNLRLEKADLADYLGIGEGEADSFHFETVPSRELVEEWSAAQGRAFPAQHQASHGALRFVATETDLLPVGMLIGPFSLTTKMLADPISPVALAGLGAQGNDDPALLRFERCLQLATATVLRAAVAQIESGARA
ncbi:MAG: hypothetical protein KIT83_20240, partial [Bryobacterales bacterium]|nr:hypothetical protein [Bryobacterales bacterium]